MSRLLPLLLLVPAVFGLRPASFLARGRPADAPAILKRLLASTETVHDPAEIHALALQVRRAPGDPVGGETNRAAAIDACKAELQGGQDRRAYANCVLRALSSRVADMDLSHIQPDEKAGFCHDVLGTFGPLTETLQKKFDSPHGDATAEMQDLTFASAVLESFQRYCGEGGA